MIYRNRAERGRGRDPGSGLRNSGTRAQKSTTDGERSTHGSRKVDRRVDPKIAHASATDRARTNTRTHEYLRSSRVTCVRVVARDRECNEVGVRTRSATCGGLRGVEVEHVRRCGRARARGVFTAANTRAHSRIYVWVLRGAYAWMCGLGSGDASVG